uniref:GST C-terminal domain-containing protein n=1 Tax=Timspurckia oligopyrenoides TaxID=708627 RepID=A0A6T6NYC4_9RHOD|mmetsp:Transcript_5029/g.8755  ORF Transcript_5029/g.8755 Transcript_5029/m.8755 type:complete len:420 (+) Transcript_5029:31-1290(+)
MGLYFVKSGNIVVHHGVYNSNSLVDSKCSLIKLNATVKRSRLSSSLDPLPSSKSSVESTNQSKTFQWKGLRVLEKGVAFGSLVKTARFFWRTFWLVMMAELAPVSSSGDYTRPSSQFTLDDSQIHALVDSKLNDLKEKRSIFRLYAGKACPWCHRVLIARALQGLDEVVELVELEPSDSGAWRVSDGKSETEKVDLRAVYRAAEKGYSGRCTAPLLVDSKSGQILCNESSNIVRLLSIISASSSTEPEMRNTLLFNQPKFDSDASLLRSNEELDELLQVIFQNVNNGVYKCGFARSQDAYDRAVNSLFMTLDELETRLSQHRYLLGKELTEADVYLFPTVFRLDAVYNPLFRCTLKRIDSHYPNLLNWMRDVYQNHGIPDTCDLSATLNQYFTNLFPLNPSGFVPAAPEIDLLLPHNRA